MFDRLAFLTGLVMIVLFGCAHREPPLQLTIRQQIIDSAIYNFSEGDRLYREDKYREAARFFEAAIGIVPTKVAYLSLAACYYRLYEYAKVRDVAEAGLAIRDEMHEGVHNIDLQLLSLLGASKFNLAINPRM